MIGIGVKVVFPIDAHKIHQTDPESVRGTVKRTTSAKKAIPAELEFTVFVGYVFGWAIFDAFHTFDAFIRIHTEESAVKTRAPMLYGDDSPNGLGFFRYSYKMISAGINILRHSGDTLFCRFEHFRRHFVGMAKDHIVGHDKVIFSLK